jgi:signal peptidase I
MTKFFGLMRRRENPMSSSSGRRRISKLALLAFLSFGSYLFFSRMVVTAVEVKGASMSPTLTSGERFLLNRFAYLHREPQRGELVVLKDPETGDMIVKRIVGLPCETIIMQNETAIVNGHRLPEPYTTRSVRANHSPLGKAIVIPRNQYFVLGDNRTLSVDSRVFGPISRESILGVINF